MPIRITKENLPDVPIFDVGAMKRDLMHLKKSLHFNQIWSMDREMGLTSFNGADDLGRIGILNNVNHDSVSKQPRSWEVEVGPLYFTKAQNITVKAATFFDISAG